MDDSRMRELALQRKKIIEENKKKYADNSRERLEKIITTKCKTIMIGAISQFEEKFGELWGHGQYRELTPDEKKMKEIWDVARTIILDNGNKQIRSLKNELEQYTMEWNKFHMNLSVIGAKDNE